MESKQELFRSFLDESEDSLTGKYFVGGFVGKAETWCDLEVKWLDSLPSGISFFHATDCFTGNGQFTGIDIPERIAILDKLSNLISTHDIRLVGYGIDATAYKRLDRFNK